MLQFLLFRFLPRRLLPLLTLYELYRLFRRWQVSQASKPPTRLIASGDAPIDPVDTLTPPKADGQVYGG